MHHTFTSCIQPNKQPSNHPSVVT